MIFWWWQGRKPNGPEAMLLSYILWVSWNWTWWCCQSYWRPFPCWWKDFLIIKNVACRAITRLRWCAAWCWLFSFGRRHGMWYCLDSNEGVVKGLAFFGIEKSSERCICRLQITFPFRTTYPYSSCWGCFGALSPRWRRPFWRYWGKLQSSQTKPTDIGRSGYKLGVLMADEARRSR